MHDWNWDDFGFRGFNSIVDRSTASLWWYVYFRFFFELTWVSTAGIAELCAFCEILFTKYKANIENKKLKTNEKRKINSLEIKATSKCNTINLKMNYQVVAQTRWIVPHANIVPTKQKQISGNSFAWNPSPKTIVSKLEIAWKDRRWLRWMNWFIWIAKRNTKWLSLYR